MNDRDDQALRGRLRPRLAERAAVRLWERPPIFDDAIQFLDGIDLPVVVVSNIDRTDIRPDL